MEPTTPRVHGLDNGTIGASLKANGQLLIALACPFCEARAAELVSLFGSQLLFSQFRCAACGSYFEGLRDEHVEGEPVAETTEGEEHGR
jgi:hypothetical protein